MKKTILLTGATDGIGFETAKKLAIQGHTLLLHGRSAEKLHKAKDSLSQLNSDLAIEMYVADFAKLSDVVALGNAVKERHSSIDVLINNAGVFKTPNPVADNGLDVRFIVNTLAPFLLTVQLLPLFNVNGRIINLSSAAQASVSLEALKGNQGLTDSAAYAQSKLAITMWTFYLAQTLGTKAPSLIAVNPASFLGSKMVKEAYGSEGKDLNIGADILFRAALSEDFEGITGKYFDNDVGSWSQPHCDALNNEKNQALISVMQELIDALH